MKSRMERYNNKENTKTKETILSRSEKNHDLYDDVYTNSTYTEYQEYEHKNVVDLSTINKGYHTREEYQKLKEYQSVISPPKVKRDLEHFESMYPTDENKSYDINDILEEAKKNRESIDELERKRKLRSTQYNILANLDLEQLEKYRENKKERLKTGKSDEEEIRELIDTITSKSLRNKIDEANDDEDLMSDLLPNEEDDTIVTEAMINDNNEESENEVDQSFYTKSMDLSDKDFTIDSEFEDIEQKKIPKTLKVFLFILLVGIMTTIAYFVIQNI